MLINVMPKPTQQTVFFFENSDVEEAIDSFKTWLKITTQEDSFEREHTPLDLSNWFDDLYESGEDYSDWTEEDFEKYNKKYEQDQQSFRDSWVDDVVEAHTYLITGTDVVVPSLLWTRGYYSLWDPTTPIEILPGEILFKGVTGWETTYADSFFEYFERVDDSTSQKEGVAND